AIALVEIGARIRGLESVPAPASSPGQPAAVTTVEARAEQVHPVAAVTSPSLPEAPVSPAPAGRPAWVPALVPSPASPQRLGRTPTGLGGRELAVPKRR